MAAVLADPEFTEKQKNILVRIALHFNVATQRCDPGTKRIATGCNASKRTVQITLAVARARGVIATKLGGGRGHTSSYRLLMRWINTAETVHSGVPFINGKGESRSRKGESTGTKGCTVIHPNRKEQELNKNLIKDLNNCPEPSEAKVRELSEVVSQTSKASEGKLFLPSSLPLPPFPRAPLPATPVHAAAPSIGGAEAG
jgi:hypothetical protein